MQEKTIRRIFIASLCLKALGALAQIGSGTLLLFTAKVTAVVDALARSELLEDPTNFFASHVSGAISHFSPHFQLFGAVYLLSHGVIKLFLVWALIKEKLWAYPASIAVFSLFILYQLVHITRGNWVAFLLFIIFEVFLLVLIWHEYVYHLKKRRLPLQ